jgi:hypothetical protein
VARAWLQKYWSDGQAGRSWESGLWCLHSPALVADAQTNPFFSAVEVKAASGFRRHKRVAVSRLKAASLKEGTIP